MNIATILAEMSGSIHVGLAALGAALGVGLIGMGASSAVGRNPGAATPILVQALVFMLLTAVFTLLICQHDEKHDAAHGKAH